MRRVDLTAAPDAVAAAAVCLSPAEIRRAERGDEEVRARRVLVRAALRELVGEVLGLPAHEVPLAGRPGRPTLVPGWGVGDLDMSCSASGNVGLVALVRGGRIGVDVQQIGDDDPAAFDEGWLSVRELTRIAPLPPSARPEALARAWAQKEAVLKAQGVGLRADMASVRSIPRESGRIGRWRISAVDVPDGYVACAAVRSTAIRSYLTPGRPVVV